MQFFRQLLKSTWNTDAMGFTVITIFLRSRQLLAAPSAQVYHLATLHKSAARISAAAARNISLVSALNRFIVPSTLNRKKDAATLPHPFMLVNNFTALRLHSFARSP